MHRRFGADVVSVDASPFTKRGFAKAVSGVVAVEMPLELL